MPRTKLDAMRPNPRAVANLIEHYIKIERDCTVGEAISRANMGRNLYYSRMKDPECFTLKELRSFAKTLKIPQEELTTAFAEAVKY